MLFVGAFDYKTKKHAKIENVTTIICQPGKKYPYGQLDPYHVKVNVRLPSGKQEDVLIENYWQFSKAYPKISKQNQWNFVEGFQGRQQVWEHSEEEHLKKENETWVPLPAYWQWREKGMTNKLAVRYPNGFKGKTKCATLITDDGRQLSYAEGREVYINAYLMSNVREHPLFKDLKARLEKGENIIIVEVDGPRYCETFPYNSVSKEIEGSYLEITRENVVGARWNTDRPFGHGWVLACMLAGYEEEMF